jgi:glycine cleavage system transcriptional repressor
MRTNIVLTVTGPDRAGLVEDVTKALLDLDGNVETSRMARLGGEFAMLLLVSFPEETADDVVSALDALTTAGYQITAGVSRGTYAETHPGWRRYRIDVDGADHEGIVHEIAAGLSRQGISIESMETSLRPAPVSGALLFSMTAEVVVPPQLDEVKWLAALDEAGRLSNVDIRVSAQ